MNPHVADDRRSGELLFGHAHRETWTGGASTGQRTRCGVAVAGIAALFSLVVAVAPAVGASDRVGLVLGNGAYAEVGHLPNPAKRRRGRERGTRATGVRGHHGCRRGPGADE